MLGDPGEGFLRQRHNDVIFLVTFLGHQGKADQAAAEAVIFRVEEVAHQLRFGFGGCATSG